MTEKGESDILEGIARGDERVLKAFYQRNLGIIQHYIVKNSGQVEDVEDIFQDALVLLYQKLQKNELEIGCSIHTYFYAICRNMWRNRLRKKHKIITKDSLSETEDILTPTIIDTIHQGEREQLFHTYFLKLGTSCRALLALIFEGKSMREISELTNLSEGYARKKKFDCKKKLLELLENDPSYQELKSKPSR